MSIPYMSSFFEFIRDFLQITPPSKTWWTWWIDTLRDWQTLIAGIAALIPASLAARYVLQQINEQRQQFMQINEYQYQKARLRLSKNLSRISNSLDIFYVQIISNNFSMDDNFLDSDTLDDILEAGVMSEARNFEFVKDFTSIAQRLVSLCRLYESQRGERELIDIFRQLASLDIMTDALYPYARFEADEIICPEITPALIVQYLNQNLRRGRDISKTNLSSLLQRGVFLSDSPIA